MRWRLQPYVMEAVERWLLAAASLTASPGRSLAMQRSPLVRVNVRVRVRVRVTVTVKVRVRVRVRVSPNPNLGWRSCCWMSRHSRGVAAVL